jgi:putative glycosyltransferase (TIGR04348 family)
MGNRVTALRWQRVLRSLGHSARIVSTLGHARPDLVVALHARKSADAVFGSKQRWPEVPVIVALTGTDLYRDVRESADARRALRLADRLVVLQSHGIEQLPRGVGAKTRVIHQSCERLAKPPPKFARGFVACVLGHLRDEKDPLRAAIAVRELPRESSIRIVQAGDALTDDWERAARAEMRANARYRWIGAVTRGAAKRLVARSHVMVLSSVIEGGANVISEACVVGTGIVASRIPSTVALLGKDHPGLFPVGNSAALRRLLLRCEREPAFVRELARRSREAAPRFEPRREQRAWREMLAELSAKRSPLARR